MKVKELQKILETFGVDEEVKIRIEPDPFMNFGIQYGEIKQISNVKCESRDGKNEIIINC